MATSDVIRAIVKENASQFREALTYPDRAPDRKIAHIPYSIGDVVWILKMIPIKGWSVIEGKVTWFEDGDVHVEFDKNDRRMKPSDVFVKKDLAKKTADSRNKRIQKHLDAARDIARGTCDAVLGGNCLDS